MNADQIRNVKVGVMVTVAIVLLVWGVNFLKGRNLLQPSNYYMAVYEHVDGLEEMAPVLVNGYKVGEVRKIFFEPMRPNYITVMLAVDDDLVVPKGSRCILYSMDVMGSKGIRLKFGSMKNKAVEPGDTLLSQVDPDLIAIINQEIAPLKMKIENMVVQMDSTLFALEQLLGPENRQLIQDDARLMKKNLENLTFLTTELKKYAKDEKGLNQLFGNLDSTLVNLNNISSSLVKADLEGTVSNIDSFFINTNSLVAGMDSASGTMGKFMKDPEFYDNMVGVTREMEDLLKDLRINPNRYVKFSAFDLGKKVYVKEGEAYENSRTQKQVLFKVAVVSGKPPRVINEDLYKNPEKVRHEEYKGEHYYVVNSDPSWPYIEKELEIVRKDYPNAFAFAVFKGKKIDLKKGKKKAGY